eukprot:gene10756-13165_t
MSKKKFPIEIKDRDESVEERNKGYHCIHDQLNPLEKFTKNIHKSRIGGALKYRKNAVEDNKKKQKKSGPIQFFVNSTFVEDQKDEFTCYKKGQIIVHGGKKADKPCVLDDESVTPCLYTCNDTDIVTPELQDLVKNYVAKATFELFSTILNVENKDENFQLHKDALGSGDCGQGIHIPEDLFSTGRPGIDHYVYITTRPTIDTNTVAYSMICHVPVIITGEGDNDFYFDRPRMSVLNFTPKYFRQILENKSRWVFNKYMRVGIHEMIHSLGFSGFLYNSYINRKTNKPVSDNIKTVEYIGTTPSGEPFSHNRSYITSDSIVDFTRKHFNCVDAPGFELEDNGAQGTKGSHWEKRIGGDEMMTGYVSPLLKLSNLTLGLLYDTGWYSINYSYGEAIYWGRDLGCDGLNDCNPKSWNHPGYFCTINNKKSCTVGRYGKGVCRVGSLVRAIPPEYQHFKNSTVGGVNRAADSCPFYEISPKEPSSIYCNDEDMQSTHSNATVFEEFSPVSRCFEYLDKFDNNQVKQSCWKYRCIHQNIVEIKIGANWITCSPNTNVTLSDGISIVCPEEVDILCDARSVDLYSPLIEKYSFGNSYYQNNLYNFEEK